MSLDFYGFPLQLSSAHQAAARQRCDAAEMKQEKAWAKYAKKNQAPVDDTRKKLCRKGIPPQHRPLQWFIISGASRRCAEKGSDYYRSMVELGFGSSTDRHQIETDLARTFPSNVWLRTSEAHQMLERVLLAYSMHNPAIGYCQGINYLAGMLLLVLQKKEEWAFWILVSLLDEGILYENMFSHNLLGAHVEMQSLAELVIEKMPKLATHLAQLHCDITIVATDWFLCLFCTSLPSETAMRVWDSLLCEGPKILYRVSLALLKTNEGLLMKIKDAGAVLRHLRDANASIHDRDALMTLAFEHVGSMPMAKIEAHRKEKQQIMAQNLRQRSSKSNLKKAISRGASINERSDGLDAAVADVSEAIESQQAIKRQYSSSNRGSRPARTPPPHASPPVGNGAEPYVSRMPSCKPKGGGGFNLFSGGRAPPREAARGAPQYVAPPPPYSPYSPAVSPYGDEPDDESMITIKDVTESSRGSFAGTIVSTGKDERLILSPQYQNK